MEELYGHGKLLLTGEYFVLDGATALAVPTQRGQSLHFSLGKKSKNQLLWESFDEKGSLWLKVTLDLSDFSILENEVDPIAQSLQKILIATRKLNPDFLRSAVSANVQTKLEFARDWGLGSSSTLIFCLAKMAEIDPFELLKKTFGGSGYDIACAGSAQPILYKIQHYTPSWETIDYFPDFHGRLFFVYLERKQNSRDGIQKYRESISEKSKHNLIEEVNQLTFEFVNAQTQKDLEYVMLAHEMLISKSLKLTSIQKQFFKRFEGKIKSLGAWGGDFVLVSNPFETATELKDYFYKNDFKTVIPYAEMVL